MSLLAGTPLACSGHILVDLPIFMGPVVILAGWLVLMTRRSRKQEQLEGTATQTDTPIPIHDREVAHQLLGVHA